MNIKQVKHKIQYYETDKMGIVHHSNYIRWFEEARLDFLEQVGLNFAEFEKEGLISPVLSISARYLSPMKYGDNAIINVYLTKVSNYKFEFSYEIIDAINQEKKVEGESSHCFLNNTGTPVSLKKEKFEIWNKLYNMVIKKGENK